MVGDSKTDIDTAKAAGVPVVEVDFGYSTMLVGQLRPDAINGDATHWRRSKTGEAVFLPMPSLLRQRLAAAAERQAV